MKVLLAIKDCHKYAHLEREQRETFLKDAKIDYRFFRGRPLLEGTTDVVTLDTDDDFASLPFKTQAICRWLLAEGYDYAFLCDTDSYVRPERLLASGFEKYDYSGFFNYWPCPRAYASGGSGYWISAKAMEIVAAASFIPDPLDFSRGGDPSRRGEDLQVGNALWDAGIACHKDERYCLYSPGPLQQNNVITLHDVRNSLKQPGRMREVHREWLLSGGRP